MKNLFVHTLGTFTSVGSYVGMTMGSIRCGFSRFIELPIRGPGSGPLVAAPTILDNDLGAGAVRMLAMAGFALRECASGRETLPTPLILCVPDPKDVPVDYGSFFRDLAMVSGVALDGAHSSLVVGEHAAIAQALEHAEAVLASGKADCCYIGGVDTLLHLPRLQALLAANRIAGGDNSAGFIPGEAAAFLRVSRRREGALAWIRGVGTGDEPPPRVSGKVTGVGMTHAMRAALDDGRGTIADVATLAIDLSGERLAFYESAVVTTRLRPQAGQAWDVWNPALCVGEVGAALGPLCLAYLSFKLGAGGFVGATTSPNGAAAMYVGTAEERARGAVFVSEVPRG